MIIALWLRFVDEGAWKWLALAAAIVALDVFVGSWLIAQELRLLREVWQ